MKLSFSEFCFEELCTILYKENAQGFLKIESSANEEQIQKDLNRTPFLSRDCQRQDMLDYLKKVLNPSSFIQGSITGAFFTSAFKNNITHELQEDIDKLEDLMSHHNKLDFFYMSNTSNKQLGFSLFSFENNWVICVADVENNKCYLSASSSFLESFEKLQNYSKKEEQFIFDKEMTRVIDFIFDEKDSISPSKVTMLSGSFSTNDNNCDIIRFLNDGAPLQLLPSQVIDAELKYLDSKGFEIEPKAYRTSFIEEEGFELLIDKEEGGSLTNEEEKPLTSFEEKKQTNANLFFVCTHEQSESKVVLFSPSTDISPQDINEKTTESYQYQYLLHTQVIAEKYINKGYTCILPVFEYADVTIAGYSATSRRHHVMLVWSKDELGFFDPKSGKIGGLPKIIGGYSNEVFKSFADKAGYYVENAAEKSIKKALSFFASCESNKTYESIKEPKIQKTLDFNNCGYFCIYRFKALICALMKKTNKPILNSRINPENINVDDLVDQISLEIAKENKNGFNHYQESYYNSFSEINKNPGAWVEVGKLKTLEGYQKTKDGATYTEVRLSERSFKFLSAKEIEEIYSKYKDMEEIDIDSQFAP